MYKWNIDAQCKDQMQIQLQINKPKKKNVRSGSGKESPTVRFFPPAGIFISIQFNSIHFILHTIIAVKEVQSKKMWMGVPKKQRLSSRDSHIH